MAEQSGFFDAHLVDGEYDRVYLSEHFARYFASFIGNGIFGGKSNELQVLEKETASMGVRVLSGQAWIDGYWYENTDELPLTIDIADGVLHRIDSIVVRWNHSERTIRLAVRKGALASSPVAPTVQRDNDYYELKLADVYVKAGTTRITQANITDKRYNTDVCGLVIGVVQQLDPDEFGIQLDAYIQEFIVEHDAWKSATQTDVDQWVSNFKTTATNWYNQFKTDSNAAVNNLLTENQAKIDKLLADGQSDIDAIKQAGETNLAKVASDGQTSINNVVTTGKADIAKVVSDGNTNINNVVNTGTTNINKVVTDGQASIKKVVDDGTTNINNLISTKTTQIDKLISDKEAEFNEKIDELEQIAADNDLVGLTRDVEDLKVKVAEPNGMGIEDETEIGCYYVEAADGSKELINAPNRPGIEYRLTERWNGSPVYQKVFYTASLPNKTVMSVYAETAQFDKIISISGFALDTDNNLFYPFPIILNGLTPIAVISNAEGDGGNGTYITINTNDDLSNFKGYIIVNYTKEAE